MDLYRRGLDGAGKVEFRDARRQIFKARDEQRRVLAADDGDRAGLALIPVFLGDDRAVPAAVIELDRQLLRPVDLHAIDRCVDPAGIGVAHDDQAAGPDIRPAVLFMPHRRRESRHVDIVAAHRILQPGGRTNFDRLLRRQCLALRHPRLQRIERPQTGVDAEGKGCTLRVCHRIGEHTKPGRMSLDAIEEQCRTIGHASRDLGDAADLMVRIGALDAPQRLECVDLGDEFAKIFVRHVPTWLHIKDAGGKGTFTWQEARADIRSASCRSDTTCRPR